MCQYHSQYIVLSIYCLDKQKNYEQFRNDCQLFLYVIKLKQLISKQKRLRSGEK